MTTFHRPKLFRSGAGCCICKAKSSSSRFTVSAKYEADFRQCFKLSSYRSGDMCNACVLIVKRWRKLPRTSKKDWAHIVDAKGAGCVGKSSGRKKIEDSEEKLHKIRRKFKVKPKISRKLEFPREPKSANIKNFKGKARIDLNLLTDFFAPSYWRRKTTCCGPVLVGVQGEIVVSKAEYKECAKTRDATISISSFISAELKMLAEGDASDEGFFDKASTNPSSPESVQTITEEL